MSSFAPHQFVTPNGSDRILSSDELLASEAATVAGMQLVMLESLLARTEVLRSLALEAAFYVTSEACLAPGGYSQERAVDLSGQTLRLAQDIEQTAKEMVDQIKPLAESVMAKNEASILAKSGSGTPH